ncbi:MAG: stage III sporulation protein AD [bacterium]|jgi:stage III sporulation protein AD|nr:stage III sporulation protein AD [Bacillota bacterium]HHW55202.1 stage III sporulation protein AD [Bacillota bacterium]
MELLPFVGLGMVATVLVLLLREERPELASLLSLAAGVMILLLLMDRIATVFNLLQQLAFRAQLDLLYLNTVLRIVAIAYIAQFGSQICRDAGESAIGGKIELAGKILIMFLAVPLMLVILDSVLQLLP